MSVLLILLSAITWVPQLLLFLFQSYLEGATLVCRQSLDGQRDLHRQRGLDSCCWRLLSQAISALVKWRVVASGALLGSVLYSVGVRRSRQSALSDALGKHLISLGALMKNVTAGLFGTFDADRLARRN